MTARSESRIITDAYRTRLIALRDSATRIATATWLAQVDPEAIDATMPVAVEAVGNLVALAQARAVTLADLYVAAFMQSETGDSATPVGVDPARYAGQTRDGRPVTDVLVVSAVAMKMRALQGGTLPQIQEAGAVRMVRTVRTETMDAARTAQADLMADNDRIDGYQRVSSGSPCAACLSQAGRRFNDPTVFPLHGACRCTAEPYVSGVRHTTGPPTGDQVFNALDASQQDALYGGTRAAAMRNNLDLDNLVSFGDSYAWGPTLWEAPVAKITG